ncbi:hypothetical protein [Cylindrospermopsis raciborskii]|uniref:hypothetical protein n=1 Tax=Cylindrospermopsis raciborskii TaxID=77022 RepID=UPI003DA1D531
MIALPKFYTFLPGDYPIAKHSILAIAQHSLREIAFRVSPASSQGKILSVLRGDRIAFPAGSRITLPRRDPM